MPEAALSYLRERLGPAQAPADASLDAVTAQVRPGRLPSHPLVDTSPQTRACYARGQSLPDWLALRFGAIDTVPDGVAFPESADDVRELLTLARAAGATVIPYGGGTSVAGHVNPPAGDTPVLTLSTERMRALRVLDETSRLATFEAGVGGPDLEAQLHARGYTLGHFPQSFEYSTLGGWIVTRSCGQQSLHYGRIEALFAGGTLVSPAGTLEIPTFPASAAGIDLREMLLGSEGRLGVLTQATVRVRRVPERESFVGIFFPDWERARSAVKAIAHCELDLSMLRLSNAVETFTTLQLASGRAVALLERYLSLRGSRDEKCLLLVGVTGSATACDEALQRVRSIARQYRGVYAGGALGERWRRNRFRAVYLRNALWERGYAVDTVETCVDWPRVDAMMHAIEAAGRRAFGDEPVHAYTHLSHVYPEGSSVYSTFVFRIAPEYETNLARWTRFKAAISEAIVANGGTITHQHGVGVDHQPYLAAEKGQLGLDAMRALFARFDPDGMMNRGKLC